MGWTEASTTEQRRPNHPRRNDAQGYYIKGDAKDHMGTLRFIGVSDLSERHVGRD